MGICSCLLSLLLLFIIPTQVMSFAEGKSVPKHPEVTKVGSVEEATARSMMIGSTPPKCEKRCSWCGHCEAVQVPVERSGIRHFFFRRSKGSVTTTSRSGDTSNYKPMSWKCKCGERILNP